MNEVTQIHLGRTAFTISVDAQKELRDYLAAITAQVGKDSADVLEEIELRMAELLSEHGIAGDTVVVSKDIAFLRDQLGEPHEFKEDEGADAAASAADTTRRLFRDTDDAMIAGVASGLAAYVGVDPIIVRLLFVVFTFIGGSGILIYIILWLLMPEAKTASDRLSMQGKAATIDNLKQVVERADVPGAARRGSRAVTRVLQVVGTVILFIVGLSLVIGAGLALLWTVAVSIYLLMNGMKVGGYVVGPLGSHEVVGFIAVAVTVLTILFMMLLVGIAMLRRRWQLPAWGLAAVVGVFFLSASVGSALAADAVPAIQHRVQSLHHTRTVQLSPFTSATITGNDLDISYVHDSKSYVRYSYYGDVRVSGLHTTVTNGKLVIAAGTLADGDCHAFCTDIRPSLEVDIHSPKLANVTINGRDFNAGNHGSMQPVFFGWQPRVLPDKTVEYSVPGPDYR